MQSRSGPIRLIEIAKENLSMKADRQQAHLRLVHPSAGSETSTPPPTTSDFNAFQKLYLPFSGQHLWLRLLPCECGGMKLYYVKIVSLDDIEEHKPYFTVTRHLAEEIVYSKHVNYGKLHRLFRVSPVSLVVSHIFRLQRLLLRRDEGLYQSTEVKRFFDEKFGLQTSGRLAPTKPDA